MRSLVIVLSLAIGGGGLLLFGWFLAAGTPFPIALARSSRGSLVIDALLCLLFFAQHSGMIRRSAKAWIARRVPASYNPALYSIASGAALFILVLLWQPVDRIVYHFGGPAPWLLGAASLAAIAGFAWGSTRSASLLSGPPRPPRSSWRAARIASCAIRSTCSCSF